MSKNPIVAIAFDPNSFPLSPHYKAWDVYEESERYVFVGHDKKRHQDNDHISVFADHENGFSSLLGEGRYYLTAYMEGDPSDFRVTFGFLNLETGETVAETDFDVTRYYLDYGREFNNAALHLCDEDTRFNHEKSFGVDYLKKHFAHLIDANEAFWERLQGDLDLATAPHNFQIHAAQMEMRQLPIHVVDEKHLEP